MEYRSAKTERELAPYKRSMDTVIERLYSDLSEDEIPKRIDEFWEEYELFTSRSRNYSGTIDFSRKNLWTSADISNGNSHLWHKKYSMRYTNLLGYVACHVTGKPLGIGEAERVWKKSKKIKSSGKTQQINSLEKKTCIYAFNSVLEERAKIKKLKKTGEIWNDDDMAFAEKLKTWGTIIPEKRKPA